MNIAVYVRIVGDVGDLARVVPNVGEAEGSSTLCSARGVAEFRVARKSA